ncbi:MAG: D-alanine--D-alanine ligase A [Gammaproteobacteria bacterium RIFCSPHIGHO2_12_FULL_37_14]|nr:MAG: D-alanine--D-alanine ligase A [Gammaproteobacteria bacterium RIFCSPHIGHO2_12_FULL_37_14]
MEQSNKIRVAVLFGGRSAEHEVSLRSAANVMQFLDPSRFEIVPIGIDKKGNWFLGQDIFARSLEQNNVPQLNHDNRAWFTAEWIGKPVKKDTLNEIISNDSSGQLFDVVFPAVHGTLCEDGTLQGLLELANIPYVGCGVLSSAIGMDKDVSKRLAMNANVPVAPYIVIKQDQWQDNPPYFLQKVIEQFGYPVFVKPANTGSSIGITKVKTANQLPLAIEAAFRFDSKILIEQALTIREIEVAVLEALEPNSDPIVSVIGEIKPHHEFYSYDAKYLDEHGAELEIPAAISEEQASKIRSVAKTLFTTLECEGMARVDLFLEVTTQQIYFNEINTLPGFTQISMYPKLMNASGVSYTDLLTHLIQLAIKRHKNKNQLQRNYTVELVS